MDVPPNNGRSYAPTSKGHRLSELFNRHCGPEFELKIARAYKWRQLVYWGGLALGGILWLADSAILDSWPQRPPLAEYARSKIWLVLVALLHVIREAGTSSEGLASLGRLVKRRRDQVSELAHTPESRALVILITESLHRSYDGYTFRTAWLAKDKVTA